MAADDADEITTQAETGLDGAVGVPVEELDRVDPDLAGRGDLFPLAQRPRVGRRRPVDPGLAAGDEQVGHLDAGGDPAVDGRGRAVLEVVGVGGDAQDAFQPLLVEPGQPVGGSGHPQPSALPTVNWASQFCSPTRAMASSWLSK